MTLDPLELESTAKAGRVIQVLSDRPALVAKLRDAAGIPREAELPIEAAALLFHRVARAAELYGRAVSAATFDAALEAMLDDAERDVPVAALLTRRAFARERFAREFNPYPDPVVLARPR